jgi:hypothetical protein
MKRILFVLFCLSSYFELQAQQAPIMVCDPTGVNCAPFYNLDAAINAANPNDYVYIPGGGWTISVVITKPLKIIGAGFHPDSTQVTGTTMISGNMYFNNNTQGTVLSGFYLTGNIGSQFYYDTLKNFHISRVNVDYIYTNYAITTGNWTRLENCFISNTVIRHHIYGAPSSSGNTIENSIVSLLYSLHNSTVKNCLITGWGNESYSFFNSTTIKNSVFLLGQGSGSYSNTNVILKNNLVLSADLGNTGVIAPINCIYDIGNCSNHFDSCSTITTYNYNDILYRLKNSSSAKNAGDDGTDIGIFGGSSPWKMGAIPSNPHIYYSNIPSSTNNIGSLPVQVKVRTEN